MSDCSGHVNCFTNKDHCLDSSSQESRLSMTALLRHSLQPLHIMLYQV